MAMTPMGLSVPMGPKRSLFETATGGLVVGGLVAALDLLAATPEPGIINAA